MYWLYGAIALVEEEEQCFVGNTQLLRKLEAVEKSLANQAKIVIPSDAGLIKLLATSTLSRGLS
jgi:hypothetical protein